MTDEVGARPRTITGFERLYLLAIAIEAARAAIDWPVLAQAPAGDRWVRLASILVSLLLVLLATRGRRRWAALVLGGLFMIGLPMVVSALQPPVPLETSAIIALQVALQALALILAAAPASRAWFGGGAHSPAG